MVTRSLSARVGCCDRGHAGEVDPLEVVLLIVGLWALLSAGALALVSGIGAAAASADRNARRQLRLQVSAASRLGRRR